MNRGLVARARVFGMAGRSAFAVGAMVAILASPLTPVGTAKASAAILPHLPAARPSLPFTQCPAIGDNTSCAVLVQVTDGGQFTFDDPSQGPYDGADDTLVGVLHSSSQPVSSIAISSTMTSSNGHCSHTASLRVREARRCSCRAFMASRTSVRRSSASVMVVA